MTPGTDRFGQLRFSASTTIKLGCKACSVAGAFDPALLERAYYLRGWALIENLFRCAQCHQDRSGGSHSTTNKWIFTVQTERVVAKDNTVAIGNRMWQIDKTKFCSTLAGCTVTIHEHLDETVSIRYGPHVVGRFDREGNKLMSATPEKRRGKGGSMEAGESQEQVFTGSHTPLEIPPKTRDSHFLTAPTGASAKPKGSAKAKPKTKAAA